MSIATVERGRITARVPASVQQTLETAAGMVGATLNQFVVQTAIREAERIIEQERVIRFSAQEAQAFLSALEHTKTPNKVLKTAQRSYQNKLNDKTGTLDWTPRSKGL